MKLVGRGGGLGELGGDASGFERGFKGVKVFFASHENAEVFPGERMGLALGENPLNDEGCFLGEI